MKSGMLELSQTSSLAMYNCTRAPHSISHFTSHAAPVTGIKYTHVNNLLDEGTDLLPHRWMLSGVCLLTAEPAGCPQLVTDPSDDIYNADTKGCAEAVCPSPTIFDFFNM